MSTPRRTQSPVTVVAATRFHAGWRAGIRVVFLLLAWALLFVSKTEAQLIRLSNTTLNLPAQLPTASGYTTQNALGSLTFSLPMATAYAPGETTRLFVVERSGSIQCVTGLDTVDDGNAATNPVKTGYLGIATLLPAGETLRTDGENGFLSLAFHPRFLTAGTTGYGTFFIFYSFQRTESGTTRLFQRLAKVTVSNPLANQTAGQTVVMTPLITQYDQATNHNGADLAFGPDGYLYFSCGDEGGGNDQYDNARRINKDFFGAIFRIDVDNVSPIQPNSHSQPSPLYASAVNPGTYRIPPDNPFLSATTWHGSAISGTTVRTEIYATGLRNPFRFSFDAPTGRLYLGDVGQNLYEEIDIITKGGDYGWSWREGLHSFTSGPAPTTPPAQFFPIDPIFEYDHTNDGVGNDNIVFGTAVTGGAVYRGSRLTELYGNYLFADYGSGHIVSLKENAGLWSGTRLATNAGIVDFGTNPYDNDLLLCNLNNGTVRRLARSGTTGTQPPSLLSQTGAFSNLASLTPNRGIVPVTPNVSFWSDYAIKQRWFSLPSLTGTITSNGTGNYDFPTGTVWIKHFDFDTTRGNPATRRKLETRFLVKTTDGVYGLSYRWRADQSDADLVAETGSSEVIPASSPAQTWRYPSRSECLTCHTQVGGFGLGFNTPQLNRTVTHGTATGNQLEMLANAGYLTPLGTDPRTLPAYAPASDTAQSLEWRARSYFAVNCVQCHQPGGSAQGNWDARSTTPLELASILSGTLVNNFNDSANRFVVPGDLTHSIALKRIQGLDVPRMPPLATAERDLAAEQLLTDWITQELPSRLNYSQWQLAYFGSTSAPQAQPGSDPDADGKSNQYEFLTRTDPTVAASAWPAPTLQDDPDGFTFDFVQPANRAALVEASTDLVTWSRLNSPANVLFYPATDLLRSIPLDRSQGRQFLRVQFSGF